MSTKIVNFFADARYEEVVEETDRFLRTVPRNTTAVHLKAQALYQLGDYGDCIRLLEKAIVYLVGREPLETRLQLAALLANAMLEEGRYEDVRELVAHSVPEESTAREEYGELLLAGAWAAYFEGLFHLANAATLRIFDVSREHFTSGRAALCAALTARREGELHRGKAYLIKAQSHLSQARNLFGNPEPVRSLYIVQAQIARRGVSEDLPALEVEVGRLPQGSKMSSLLRQAVALYRRHLHKEPIASSVNEAVRSGVKRSWVALLPGAQARRPTIVQANVLPEPEEAPDPAHAAGDSAAPESTLEAPPAAATAPPAEEVVPDMAAILPAVEPEPEYVPLEEPEPDWVAAPPLIPGVADAAALAEPADAEAEPAAAEAEPADPADPESAPAAAEADLPPLPATAAEDAAASESASSESSSSDVGKATSASGIIRELSRAPHLEASPALDDLFSDESEPPRLAPSAPVEVPKAPPPGVAPASGGSRPPARPLGPLPVPAVRSEPPVPAGTGSPAPTPGTPRAGVPAPPAAAAESGSTAPARPRTPPAAPAPTGRDTAANADIPVAPVARDAGYTRVADVTNRPRRGPVVRTAEDATLLRHKNPPVGSILLVEPTDRLANAFEECIRDSSFKIAMRVGDIDSALEQYVLLRPTLVVVDLQAPGVTGLHSAGTPAFVRMFLELDSHAKIAVIYSTPTRVMVLEALRQGARAQIEQPFERSRVLDALSKAMSARSALEALRVPTLELRRPVACSWRPLESGMRTLLEPWRHFVARSLDPMGLEATIDTPLRVGTLLRLNLEIPGGDKPIQTLAEITSCKPEPAIKLNTVRFSFVKLPPDARDRLVSFLMSAIEKAQGKTR